MRGPFPGNEGQDPYCGYKRHVYRVLPPEPMFCINCHHVKGQRKKKADG